MRAEALAHPTFFAQRAACGDWVFAQLPISVELVHRVALDTATKTTYCTCPFVPKPCVHAEALHALFAREGTAVFEPTATLPDWLSARIPHQPTHQSTSPSIHQPNNPPTHQPVLRLDRAHNGFEDLETWLLDTLRRGVATAVSEDPDFYKTIATRLADASMRGLSRSLRTLEAVPGDHPDWPLRITAVLADAALALHVFRRRALLPEPLLHDLEAFVGFSQKKEAVRAEGESLRDAWAVVGAVEEPVEDSLRQRRTWLFGASSNRFALLLEYAHGGLEFLPGFAPGSVVEGELVFYPSAWQQRALASDGVKTLPKRVEKLPGFEKIDCMARTFASALGKQPWLAALPVVLNQTIPMHHQHRFRLADADGKAVALNNPERVCWSLLALSGGRAITVFGEWNGQTFNAISAIAQNRFVAL